MNNALCLWCNFLYISRCILAMLLFSVWVKPKDDFLYHACTDIGFIVFLQTHTCIWLTEWKNMPKKERKYLYWWDYYFYYSNIKFVFFYCITISDCTLWVLATFVQSVLWCTPQMIFYLNGTFNLRVWLVYLSDLRDDSSGSAIKIISVKSNGMKT